MGKIKTPYWQSTKCPLKKRGIPPKFTHITEEHIDEIIIMYKTGKYSYKDIADHFNRHISSIAELLNKRGFNAKSQSELQRKYEINERVFENGVNSEEEAYVLGFLYADGYMHSKSNSIKICLSASDDEILKRFLNVFETNRSLIYYNNVTETGKIREYVRFCISNKKIYLNLISLGCVPKKSAIIRFPFFIEKEYWRHFVRGYFDGDGGFSVSKTIHSNVSFRITSNKNFLKDLLQVLVSEIGLNMVKILEAPNLNPLFGSFGYGGRDNCKKFGKWIYNDANIYLERKYKKYLSICEGTYL